VKPNELKKWMVQNNASTVDVAFATRVSVRTVERYLKGETDPHKILSEALQKLIDPPEPKESS